MKDSRMAERIEVVLDQESGRSLDLLVDGKPFPWFVADHVEVKLTHNGKAQTITVEIPADRVVIVEREGEE